MGDIDRKRWEAVCELQRLGCAWRDGEWRAPTPPCPSDFPLELLAATDAMHADLRGQIDDRIGCLEDSHDVEMMERVADLVDCYKAVRPKVRG
jgi:hypothetical protein